MASGGGGEHHDNRLEVEKYTCLHVYITNEMRAAEAASVVIMMQSGAYLPGSNTNEKYG